MVAFDIDRLCLELFVASACIIISLCIIKCLFVKCLSLKTDLYDEDDVGWLLGKNVPGYYLMMIMLMMMTKMMMTMTMMMMMMMLVKMLKMEIIPVIICGQR